MPDFTHRCDILIVGGGPAGMAAAYTAAQSGKNVIIIDENPSPGGQIWRGGSHQPQSAQAHKWFQKLASFSSQSFWGNRVIHRPQPGVLVTESPEGVSEIIHENLILATGARERFLPFPGWTLPGVTGAGGLQALVKSGWPIAGKRVVVAGSGPLLLAVAAFLKAKGAHILSIVEQTTLQKLSHFACHLLKHPPKLWQAFFMKTKLWGVPYLTECWPTAATGEGYLESITLQQRDKTWELDCDYLACGFGLIPNLELAHLCSCQVKDGFVVTDQFQQTTEQKIYSAGEVTGIGGVEEALIEGQIAGYAASGRREEARQYFSLRDRHRIFADSLNAAFMLNDNLRNLPQDDTIICRCEDVTAAQLKRYSSWRQAKLQTRCGMGVCQGRVCGAAITWLYEWELQSLRPPVFPASMKCFS